MNVNPARAGMIPSVYLAQLRGLCKPRASGDDPDLREREVPGQG